MKILAVAASLLRIIGEIARSPALAAFPSAVKFGAIVANLADTGSKLIARGEEGLAELRDFKNHVADLRDRLAAGTLTPEMLIAELDIMQARSDAAHDELQSMKPVDDVEQPAADPPPPAAPAETASTEETGEQ